MVVLNMCSSLNNKNPMSKNILKKKKRHNYEILNIALRG